MNQSMTAHFRQSLPSFPEGMEVLTHFIKFQISINIFNKSYFYKTHDFVRHRVLFDREFPETSVWPAFGSTALRKVAVRGGPGGWL